MCIANETIYGDLWWLNMTTMYMFAVFWYEVYSFSKEYDVYEILFKMECSFFFAFS